MLYKYSAKVYAVVNTILYDDELEAARRLLWELYDAGVDAFIVQDPAIFRMERPPLPLFASTQTHIRTPQQAQFLSSRLQKTDSGAPALTRTNPGNKA